MNERLAFRVCSWFDHPMSATFFAQDDIRIPPKPLRIELRARPRLLALPRLETLPIQLPAAAVSGLLLAWCIAGALTG